MKSINVTSALALTFLLVTSESRATPQGASAKGAPAPTSATPSATPATTGTATTNDEAKRLFYAGVALLQDPEGERVEEAYGQFKRAYELSHMPKILGNLGYCALRLERDGEAIDAYKEYLRQAPDIDPRERTQIERDLEVASSAARVTLEVRGFGSATATLKDTRTPVRGSPVINSYGTVSQTVTLRIRPGHHVFTVSVDDQERGRWEVDTAAGLGATHVFELLAPVNKAETIAARRPARPSIVPWIVAGVGAATLAGGGVAAFVTANKVSDLDKQRLSTGEYPNTASFNSEKSSAQGLATVSYVLLGVGGGLTLVGLSWALLASPARDSSSTSTAIRLQPACSVGGCSGSLTGTF